MPTITAINPQRRSGRYNIMVDDVFAIAVSEKVLVDLRLSVGDQLDESRILETATAEDRSKALSASLRLLASRHRSQREIENRLEEHGYSAPTINEVTEKLSGYGLINDAEFAAAWVDSRSRCQPSGPTKLKAELFQKGVARETIDQAIATISEDDEITLARTAISRKSRAVSSDTTERNKEYTRQANFLLRRGFRWPTVQTVLKEHFGSDLDND